MTITAPTPTQAPPRPPERHRPRRRWWNQVPPVGAWLSLLVVVALWVANRGGQDLASLGPGLTSVGRLSGLVAADLLLVQVLLMARIPWVERTYGQDRLAHWHRWLGFSSFSLLWVHIVLITMGYASTGRLGVVAQAWDLVVHYPGMLLATAGTACLVLVVVTSVRAARRRLRYESWHLLHLYAYLGVGLGLPHQVWTGTDFVFSPLARTYWWSLYGASVAAVVCFRLGLPAYRTLRHGLRVAGVVVESPGIVSVWVRGRDLDRMPVQSGQFLQWRFLGAPGWSRTHPYSLSAPPSRDYLRITVKELGDGSAGLADVRPGSRVIVEGPYGRLTGDVRRGRGVTVIGSGIGITPLRALVESLPYDHGDATVVYRAAGAHKAVFLSEFEKLAASRGLRRVYLFGPRAVSRHSWLPEHLAHEADGDALARIVPGIAAHDVYVCGPNDWMDAVRAAALAAGVPAAQVHLERFDW